MKIGFKLFVSHHDLDPITRQLLTYLVRRILLLADHALEVHRNDLLE